MSDSGTSPSSLLITLVDLTGGNAGAAFLKRAPDLETIKWWALLFQSQGKSVRRLTEISSELEPMQYLIWNTTQNPPADDLEAVRAKCVELANNLEVDQTPADQVKALIPADFLATLNLEGETTMGQGSTTDGTLEKGASKSKKGGKKGKKASTEGVVTGDSGTAENKETKAKKEKDPTGRPGEGTSTRKVWDIADSLAKANNDVTPTRAAVIEAAVKAGVNKATAGVQYGAWFKGMKRTPAPAPPEEKKEESSSAAS